MNKKPDKDDQLIFRLTSISAKELLSTMKVLKAINFNSAYGHHPEVCKASAKVMSILSGCLKNNT